MKKIFLLSIVVAFALFGMQAFASPPVPPPVEGFIILTTTDIDCPDGDVEENQAFNWTYYDGWGTGPFYPYGADGQYVPAGACLGTVGSDCCGPAGCDGLVSELGFSSGAEIAYKQDFKSKDGSTSFFKTFEAYSHPDAAAGQKNLKVHKEITFVPANDESYAEHSERVGLSIISMGAATGAAASPATGLLSLCPWATDNGSSGKGWPATNEGIAAGSHFMVNSITGFRSDSVVTSTSLPSLEYDLDGGEGVGFIEAGFVVELWEAPKGYVWAPVPVEDTCCEAGACVCDMNSSGNVWQLPQYAYGEPPLASRTSYSEYASADGTWTFKKHVLYKSVMPAGPTNPTFPIDQVPF